MLIQFYGWKFYLQNISEMCAYQMYFPLQGQFSLHITGRSSPRESLLQEKKWNLPLHYKEASLKV
jgi:hypothetical protein